MRRKERHAVRAANQKKVRAKNRPRKAKARVRKAAAVTAKAQRRSSAK